MLRLQPKRRSMSKNFFAFSAAIVLPLALAATPSAAQIVPQQEQRQVQQQQTPRAPVTLNQWARLTKKDRQIAVIAAVEGLLLASSSPNNPPDLSNQCLSEDTPETVERKMSALVKQYGNEAFVDVFLVVTKCVPQGQRGQ